MDRLLSNPNLPDGRVTLAIVSPQYGEITSKINKLGIRTMSVGENGSVAKPLRFHSDMLCHHTGGGKILLSKEQKELFEALKKYNFEPCFISEELCEKYPFDIRLNCLRIGSLLFANINFMSEKIRSFCQENSIELVAVKQGYARCSAAIVNERAVITQDRGMARAFYQKGVDVLLIDGSDITLDGYESGFIGGACSLIDKNTLLFFGDISRLRDYKSISEFLKKHKCEGVCLDNIPPTDIGGMIPLLQK